MKSPFPGMDPYIEASGLWGDFHTNLIADIQRALAAALPPGYLARAGRRSYLELIEENGKERHSFVPDVSVTSTPGRKRSAALTGRTAPPLVMHAFIEEEYRERFIDIYEEGPPRLLVTSIEVLSPSNKRRGSVGWRKYQRKRKALLLGKANLVEIDLLIGGTRMPMLAAWPNRPYFVLVARADDGPRCGVWPASFDEPLPKVPVPLNSADADVMLDLQPLVDEVYQRNNYGSEIDYAAAPPAGLSADNVAALAKRLRERAGRKKRR